jgi:hypothetical protein
VRVVEQQSVTDAQRWLSRLVGEKAATIFALNIAGPRESEMSGITDRASTVLREILVAIPLERNNA